LTGAVAAVSLLLEAAGRGLSLPLLEAATALVAVLRLRVAGAGSLSLRATAAATASWLSLVVAAIFLTALAGTLRALFLAAVGFADAVVGAAAFLAARLRAGAGAWPVVAAAGGMGWSWSLLVIRKRVWWVRLARRGNWQAG